MLHSLKILESFEALKRAGFPLVWEVGQRVGRGFADIGAEEFSILPGEKILSLCTGTVSEVSLSDRDFFFSVPTCDEMTDFIQQRGHLIEAICTVDDGRGWQVRVHTGQGEKVVAESSTIELALVELICALGAG